MKKLYVIIFLCLLTVNAVADNIFLTDGTIKKGSITQITSEWVEYDPDGPEIVERIPLNTVIKIEYDKAGYSSTETSNEPRPFFKREDTTQSWFLPMPLRISYLYMNGLTNADIFDKEGSKIASGDATFTQKMLSLSIEKVATNFYITPELGYFFRNIKVKDFSANLESINTDTEGYISSVVTDPATGQEISKDSVYSLNYTAKFFSYFCDLKAGANLVTSGANVNVLLNLYVSANLVDLRKSEFIFQVGDNEETFKTSYKFNFFSSYGFGIETGMFFPKLRSGVKIGYDMRMMRKFEIPSEVKFKEVYKDDTLGLYRTKENSAKYTAIQAHLLTVTAFIFI